MNRGRPSNESTPALWGAQLAPQTLLRFLSHESTAVVHQSGRGHLEGRQDRGVEEKAGDLGFKKALRRSTDEL